MDALPDWLKKEDYFQAKKWLFEAGVCFERSWVLLVANHIFQRYDWHGVMEALQHTNELCIKSLFTLVGLEWLRTHNPAEQIDRFNERYFELFPDLKDNPVMRQITNWAIWHRRGTESYHQAVIYGKEEEGKFPSESFTYED